MSRKANEQKSLFAIYVDVLWGRATGPFRDKCINVMVEATNHMIDLLGVRAQVLEYLQQAKSPRYGYAGRINTVKKGIAALDTVELGEIPQSPLLAILFSEIVLLLE